jgi:anti-anti-sigma regulatory factor
MTTNGAWIIVEPERVAEVLQQDAVAKVTSGQGVALDFRSVPRIDSRAVKALGELADLAGGRPVKITLRGVNQDIYKVLKLVQLTGSFSFLT